MRPHVTREKAVNCPKNQNDEKNLKLLQNRHKSQLKSQLLQKRIKYRKLLQNGH